MENKSGEETVAVRVGKYEIQVEPRRSEFLVFQDFLVRDQQVIVRQTPKPSLLRAQQSGVGLEVCVTARFMQNHFETAAVISKVIGAYFLIDLPFLPISGTVHSKDKTKVIGFVLPIKGPHNFSVGLSLHCFLTGDLFIPFRAAQYPVFPVFSYGQGSGVSIGGSLIITSGHVVKSSQSFFLVRPSKRKNKIAGKILKIGKVLDLAVAKSQKKLKAVRFARSFVEGQRIICVGYCFEDFKEPVITHGHLTKIVYYHGFPIFAMISAKTFNGQSGGGVFNSDLELIGIITANANNENDSVYEDLGFCILATVFSGLSKKPKSFHYLWEEQSQAFADLFTFQTTTSLPSPKL